jgi:hypothetical protein
VKNKVQIEDDTIQLVLLYSRITIALNAARVMKTLGLIATRKWNQTEEYIIRFAQMTMMVNSAAVVDKDRSALNLRRLAETKGDISEDEKNKYILKVDQFYNRHQKTIKHVIEWRNNFIVHTNKGINSIEKFLEIENGDISDIQKMLNEAAETIESLSWFPKDVSRNILDYEQIKIDLNL